MHAGYGEYCTENVNWRKLTCQVCVKAQYADGMQVSENLALKMQIGIKNTHNAMKSRPLPTSSAKKLLKTTVHTGPQGLPPPEPRKARNILPFETIIGKLRSTIICQGSNS